MDKITITHKQRLIKNLKYLNSLLYENETLNVFDFKKTINEIKEDLEKLKNTMPNFSNYLEYFINDIYTEGLNLNDFTRYKSNSESIVEYIGEILQY